jgi:peroxiredoxin
MVLTPSNMPELGGAAPDFRLAEVTTGSFVTRNGAARSKGLLVMFICRHCPFVMHVQEELARLGRDYARSDVGIVAIGANDPESHPEDAPGSLSEMARKLGFTFPYAHDETQSVAKAYGAACTPDFFLYDGALRLVYRGQLDDSRPGNGKPVTGRDLRAALDAVIAGRSVSADQKASIGCNIKWRPGNEPR